MAKFISLFNNNVNRKSHPVHFVCFGFCQVGLFRKSGVKSRIQYLRELVESDPDSVSYGGQSAFDVADMVKQYFRDLPEPIFTSKLCESFLHIYQCECFHFVFFVIAPWWWAAVTELQSNAPSISVRCSMLANHELIRARGRKSSSEH